MKQEITDEFVQNVVDLGGLMMTFGKVFRATYLDKNGTKESDTDHTTMLAVMACAIASSLQLDLDLGKVAHYALVHDLVEVYAGDVNTINFQTTDHKAKEENEAAALQRIKEQFGETFPWIHKTIEAYESLSDPEARYIKTLDKILPAITHIHTDNMAVNEGFDDPVAFETSVRARNEHMRNTFAHDQELVMQLREKLLEPTIVKKYQHHGKERTNS